MADIKIAYGASSALTCTLASLATSSTLLVGRETTAVSNTSGLYSDYLVAGKITTGTTPTANTRIEIWAYGSLDDTPTYPDVIDGTDSDETMTSENVKLAALRFVTAIVVDSTSDRTYYFGPQSLAQVFGGQIPKNFGLFVTHSTAVNLNATGSNHSLTITPVYATVT